MYYFKTTSQSVRKIPKQKHWTQQVQGWICKHFNNETKLQCLSYLAPVRALHGHTSCFLNTQYSTHQSPRASQICKGAISEYFFNTYILNVLYKWITHTITAHIFHLCSSLFFKTLWPSSYFTKSKVIPKYTVRQLDCWTHSPKHL